MYNLTLNALDEDLVSTIQRLAERDDIPEDQAAVKLIRKGAGLEDETSANGKIGNSLDEVIGTWTEEEAAEFDAAVAELRVVDESMWR